MADSRFITLVTAKPFLTVTGLRGDVPQRTGGVGGWIFKPRPRAKALTVFDGVEPLQQIVSFILGIRPGGQDIVDGAQQNISAAEDCNTLERMGRPPSPGAEPPIVRVVGAVAHSDIDWIITGLDWATDDTVQYSRSGFVTRQPVAVHLTEYVAADRLQDGGSAAKQMRDQAAALTVAARAVTSGTYIVKASDLPPLGHGLDTIAAHDLGSYKLAAQLGTLNGIRDGRTLKVGQRLRLR